MHLLSAVRLAIAAVFAACFPRFSSARPIVELGGSLFTYALGECIGRGASMKCIGLGPNSTRPYPHVEHLEIASLVWSPTRGTVQQIFPSLQVNLKTSDQIFSFSNYSDSYRFLYLLQFAS